MKIIIETNTKVSPKEVFEYIKEKCKDALRSYFKITIEEANLCYEQKDEPKTSS